MQACNKLCCWYDARDYTNYARWLRIHVRVLIEIAKKHPEVHAEFLKGIFVVKKSARKFSLVAKEQTNEQSNKSLQTHGRAVGLYENPKALILFMLAGPDCTWVSK